MKVDVTSAVPPVSGTGHRMHGRMPEQEEEERQEPAEDEVILFGIPQEQMTPQVRHALDTLLARLQQTEHQLERAQRKVSELEVLADRDPLTPAFNRRAFLRELERAIALAARHESRLSLVFIDIDNLKTLNDRHGHAAGDMALKTLAEILVAHTRSSDLIGRIGGDEFALLLPQTAGTSATDLAERLSQAVADRSCNVKGGETGLSISYGVHEINAQQETAEQAMSAADEAMYVHKRRLETQASRPQRYAMISGSNASRSA